MTDAELFSLKLSEMNDDRAFEALKERLKSRKERDAFEKWIEVEIKLHGKENVKNMLKSKTVE